jgi:hypothetical protein
VAGIVVSREGGIKYASAHDLRRSFGTRWAKKKMPAILQKLMRHANISTTEKYYMTLEADEVMEELWEDQKSTTSSTTPADEGCQVSEDSREKSRSGRVAEWQTQRT